MKIQDMQITDGPWQVEKRAGEEGYSIVGDIGSLDGIETSVDVCYVWSKLPNKEALYNAKLLAQAPEMALILEAVIREMHDFNFVTDGTLDAISDVLDTFKDKKA